MIETDNSKIKVIDKSINQPIHLLKDRLLQVNQDQLKKFKVMKIYL